MKNHQGLTLISLLFAVSISATLCSIAAPSLSAFLGKQQGLAAVSLIHRNLGKARALAIQAEQFITVCGIDQQNQCERDGIEKLAMFNDTNRNAELDPDETIFYISDLKYRGSLQWRAGFRRTFIRFTPEGSAEQAGSFIYCDPEFNMNSRRLTVSLSGRAYLGRPNRNGEITRTNGDTIRC